MSLTTEINEDEERKICDYVYNKNTTKFKSGDKCQILCHYGRTRCANHNKKKLAYHRKYYLKTKETKNNTNDKIIINNNGD